VGRCGLDSSGSGCGVVAGFFVKGNETSRSINKQEIFLEAE